MNLKKFGKFKDESIRLSPNFNLILGNNEGGKTTITHAIDVLYNGFSPANHNYRYIPFDEAQAELSVQLSLKEKNCYLERKLLKNALSKLSYNDVEERFKNEPLNAMIPSGELSSELLDRRLWYFDHRTLGKKLDMGKWESWKQLASDLYLEDETFSFADVESGLNEKISNLYTNNSNSKSEIAKVMSQLRDAEEKIKHLQMEEEELKEVYRKLEEGVQKKENLVLSIEQISRKIRDLKDLSEYKQRLIQFQMLKEEWGRAENKNSMQAEMVQEYEEYLLLRERNLVGRDAKREQKRELLLQKQRLDEFYSAKGELFSHLSELKKDKKFKQEEKEHKSHLCFRAEILFLASSGILMIQMLLKMLHLFKITSFLEHSDLFNLLILFFFVLTILSGFARTYFRAGVKKHDGEISTLEREISKYEHDMDMGMMQIEEMELRIRNLEAELQEDEKKEKLELSSLQEKLFGFFGTYEIQECKKKMGHTESLRHRLELYQLELERFSEKIKAKEFSFFDDIVFEKESSNFEQRLLQTDLQALISNYKLLFKNQNELILDISKRIGGYENRLSTSECSKLPSYEMKKRMLKERLETLKEEYSVLVFLKAIFNRMKVISYQKKRPDFEICLNKYFEEFLSEKKFDIRLNSQRELEINRVDLIEALDIERISTGTLAQIYFLFKLSVLEKIDPESSIPMIIDGAFDHYDPHRIKSMIGILERIAEKRQVIVLSSTPISDFKGKIIKISD